MTADVPSIEPDGRPSTDLRCPGDLRSPGVPGLPVGSGDMNLRPMAPSARARRAIATIVGLVLLVAGSAWGTDDDFPVGPFRMYSTRGDPDGVVRELRVQIVLASGTVRDVTNAAGAPRRAELEGRLGDLTANSDAFRALVPLYASGLPEPARTLRLVWSVHALHAGRATPSGIVVICQTPVAS